MEMGVSIIVVEEDNVGVNKKLHGESLDRSLYGRLIEEVKRKLRRFDAHRINVVRRTANEVASGSLFTV